jgi:hypothetical protein
MSRIKKAEKRQEKKKKRVKVRTFSISVRKKEQNRVKRYKAR